MSRTPRKSHRRSLKDAGAPVQRAAAFEGSGNEGNSRPESLAYDAGFARLIASISRDFLAMAPDQIDQGIQAALRAVGEYAGVDRAFEILASEIRRDMMLAGCPAIGNIDAGLLRHAE